MAPKGTPTCSPPKGKGKHQPAYQNGPVGNTGPPWRPSIPSRQTPPQHPRSSTDHSSGATRPPRRYQPRANSRNDRPTPAHQDRTPHRDHRIKELQQTFIDDTPTMRIADARRDPDWEGPPRRADVLKTWRADKEQHIRSLALTAARQICDGSDRDADDTVIKIQCAKAQLASALPIPDQVKLIRKHLNRIENEIQATTDQLEAATKQLSELNTKSRQLTNILHDLREEISDRRRSIRRPTPTAGHAKELDTQRHSAPATASRTRRSSVTRARPTRHTKEAATRPATTAEQAIRAHRAEALRPTQAGRATQ